ncbi:hypothetical protein DFH06DRAFT_1465719 [Mycena polygramma]|nr:hypothetical protein DFH06DRAFT_1465719 [Mycena polygramma]
MSSSAILLKVPRLLTLFLAWARSLISLAIGKSNRDINRVKTQVPESPQCGSSQIPCPPCGAARRACERPGPINAAALPRNVVHTVERVKMRDSDFGYGACLFPVSLVLSWCYGRLGRPPLLATLAEPQSAA